MKKLALGALLVAVVAVAAWAGADHGPLSANDYRARLNRICTGLTARYDEIGEPKSLAELVGTAPQFIAAFDGAVAAVQRLRPPTELKDLAGRFVAVSAKIRDLLDDLVEAVKEKDQATLAKLGMELDPLAKETDAIANRLGVPVCAS